MKICKVILLIVFSIGLVSCVTTDSNLTPEQQRAAQELGRQIGEALAERWTK